MTGALARLCVTGIVAGQFLLSGAALAGPKEDVAAATTKWASALGQNDHDKVLPFYAKDAVLWERFLRRFVPLQLPCENILSMRTKRFQS